MKKIYRSEVVVLMKIENFCQKQQLHSKKALSARAGRAFLAVEDVGYFTTARRLK